MIKGAQISAPLIHFESLTDRCLTVHHGHMTTASEPVLVDASKLGGVHEIHLHLGVPTTNVTTWMSRRYQNGFPDPVKELAMGGVYDLDAVKVWYDAFTQRPRTTKKATPTQ